MMSSQRHHDGTDQNVQLGEDGGNASNAQDAHQLQDPQTSQGAVEILYQIWGWNGMKTRNIVSWRPSILSFTKQNQDENTNAYCWQERLADCHLSPTTSSSSSCSRKAWKTRRALQRRMAGPSGGWTFQDTLGQLIPWWFMGKSAGSHDVFHERQGFPWFPCNFFLVYPLVN